MTAKTTILRAFVLALAFLGAFPGAAENQFKAFLKDSEGKEHGANGGPVELDFTEGFELLVHRPAGALPSEALPFGAYIKSVELRVVAKDRQFTKILEVDRRLETVRFLGELSALITKDDLDISTQGLRDLTIVLSLTYWGRGDPEIPLPLRGYTEDLGAEEARDSFTIEARHYGPYLLFNLSPLGGNFGAATLDALLGAFSSLALSSVDWPLVYYPSRGSGGFAATFALFSAPVFYYETRRWYGNFDLEGVVAKDLSPVGDSTGMGLALGCLRGRNGTMMLKVGYLRFLEPEESAIFFGLSIPALSSWISSR